MHAEHSQERLLATKRQLEGTGAFTFTNLAPQLSDSLRSAPDGEAFVPIQIDTRTRERHQLRAETFALQREVVSDVESELGLGVGLTYENTNVLGGGERFQMRRPPRRLVRPGRCPHAPFAQRTDRTPRRPSPSHPRAPGDADPAGAGPHRIAQFVHRCSRPYYQQP
ncbi:MAG: hypothetical protein ACQETP_05395 [Bacteroidota bacterium]